MGKFATVDELLNGGFDAVFIGTGAGLPYFMKIPGENACGVYSANEFLTRTNLMKPTASQEAILPSGGESCRAGRQRGHGLCRMALRLGTEESIVYRRSVHELLTRREVNTLWRKALNLLF